MKFRFEKNVLDLLEGSIDIHIHSAPDVYPRLLNDVELAFSAKENGMRAILVKNHYFETAGRAQLATDVADFPVFGGIALNLTNGGLNKHAVKMALKMGAKAGLDAHRACRLFREETKAMWPTLPPRSAPMSRG